MFPTNEESIRVAVDEFIGIRRVTEITGFSKSSILRKIDEGEFPEPVIQEANVTRYSLASVLAWQEKKKKERAERLKQADQRQAA